MGRRGSVQRGKRGSKVAEEKSFVAEEKSGLYERELLRVFAKFSFWRKSINRNSIIMIRNEYHYVINLGNFWQFLFHYRPCLFWANCARSHYSELTQRILSFLLSIVLRLIFRNKFSHDIIWTTPIKLLPFISTNPVHSIHSTIKISNFHVVSITLTFIFHISLHSFKETPSNHLVSGEHKHR